MNEFLKKKTTILIVQTGNFYSFIFSSKSSSLILLVSSLSVLIVLLVVAAIFVAIHTDGQSKVSFHVQSYLLVIMALEWLFVSLVEPDSF